MKRPVFPLPYSVPLEDADNVRSRMDTPADELMAHERRSAVIRSLPYTRWQMIFLLIEYGFTEAEIAEGMRIREKSVRNVKYFIRSKLRNQ